MNLLGIYEIAQITKKTKSAVINWRNRYEDFPKPVIEVKSGPLFDEYDIRTWLDKNEYDIEEIRLEKKGYIVKKIFVIGRARIGKSRLISRFCKYSSLFSKYFTGRGKDCTKVNTRVILKKSCSDSLIRYYGPGSSLNGMQAKFDDDNGENIALFIKKIEEENTYSQNEKDKGSMRGLDPERDVIEIVTYPSSYALSIMDDYISELIITDTPGVSGKVQGLQNASDADAYILMMQDENGDEFRESIEKMVPVIAGSKVIYVYKTGTSIGNQSDYEEMKEETRIAIEDFANELLTLRGGKSIIDSTIEVLNPSDSVIPMGSFGKSKTNYAEEIFNIEFAKVIQDALNDNILMREENDIVNLMKENINHVEVLEFAKELMGNINFQDSISGDNYKEKFIAEKHDRVKTADKYIISNYVDSNRTKLLKRMYEHFSVIQVDENRVSRVPKKLQELIIKYSYKKICESIKFDCGLFQEGHPFADSIPKTMWAEEAILMPELVNNNATNSCIKYTETMRKNGIKSQTWGYVQYPTVYDGRFSYRNKKKDVIMTCELTKYSSSSLEELIFNSYNIALMKLGQYAVVEFLLGTAGINNDPLSWIV